jgi:hypothetical protein
VAPGVVVAGSDTLFPILDGAARDPQFKFLQRPQKDNLLLLGLSPGGTPATSYVVSGFARNAKPADGSAPAENPNYNQIYFGDKNAGSAGTDCTPFLFKEGETYAVKWKMPTAANGQDTLMTQFQTGVDHMAVGLRSPADADASPLAPANAPADIQFYPPQQVGSTAGIDRYAEFAVKADMSACLAFTFSFYSMTAPKGRVNFSDFYLLRKNDEAFHFVRAGEAYPDGTSYEDGYATYATGTPTTAAEAKIKREVKAFEMLLQVNKRGEITGTYSRDETGMVIPVPNNGIAAKKSE